MMWFFNCKTTELIHWALSAGFFFLWYMRSVCCCRLESLCINGCQMITNEGLITVIKKHGKWWELPTFCQLSDYWQFAVRSLSYWFKIGVKIVVFSLRHFSVVCRLRVLEMFGCFNIKAKAVSYLSANCINLKTLNLGQCYKVRELTGIS